MTSRLDRLTGPEGSLKTEPRDPAEFEGLKTTGLRKLKDAENPNLSLDSRFDLAYAAAHSLSLAALRHRGYRPSKRYIVFQTLAETLGLGAEVWRVLDKCHNVRNRIEYEGASELDEELVNQLIKACQAVAKAVRALT